MELNLQDLVSHEINILRSRLKRKLGAKMKTQKLFYKDGCWSDDVGKRKGKWKIELTFDIDKNEKIKDIKKVSWIHDFDQ